MGEGGGRCALLLYYHYEFWRLEDGQAGVKGTSLNQSTDLVNSSRKNTICMKGIIYFNCDKYSF